METPTPSPPQVSPVDAARVAIWRLFEEGYVDEDMATAGLLAVDLGMRRTQRGHAEPAGLHTRRQVHRSPRAAWMPHRTAHPQPGLDETTTTPGRRPLRAWHTASVSSVLAFTTRTTSNGLPTSSSSRQ